MQSNMKYLVQKIVILFCFCTFHTVAIAQQQQQIVLVGAIDYTYTQTLPQSLDTTLSIECQRYLKGVFEKGHIKQLHNTLTEIKSVESLVRKYLPTLPVTLLVEKDATEENIRNIKRPFILHIATHGFVLPSNLSCKIGGNEAEQKTGLFLAGCEKIFLKNFTNLLIQGEDDEILNKTEIETLDLFGTALVVLSACETATGNHQRSEALVSLQNACIIAGAKAVIASKWNIDDEKTVEFMETFYQYWLKNASSTDVKKAFDAAVQDFKQKYEDPYYWAAFDLKTQ